MSGTDHHIAGRRLALHVKPFFAYYPFTAPHWPLQAPQEIRDKYKGMYDDGWHKLKERRLAAQVKLGLMEEGVVPRQMDNPFNIEEWDELSAEQKAKSARAMETVRGVGPNANSWIQYSVCGNGGNDRHQCRPGCQTARERWRA